MKRVISRLGSRLATQNAAGFFFSALAVGLYNLIWFNRYFVVAEGWFSAYADRWLRGFIPYRDTALFLPPLYTWQLVLIRRLFGPEIVHLRVLGVLVMMCLAAAVFALYRRLTSPPVASTAAALSVIYFESFNAFIPYDFHSFDSLYGVLAALFLIKFYECEALPGQASFLALSGLFASLALLIKQSTGILMIAMDCLLVSIAYLRAANAKSRLAALFFAVGLAVPLLVFAAWLFAYSSPQGFYESAIGVLGAKGSLGAILFRFIGLQFNRYFFYKLALTMAAAATLFALAKWEPQKHPEIRNLESTRWAWGGIAALALCIILLPIPFSGISALRGQRWMRTFSIARSLGIPFALVVSLAALIDSGRIFWRTGERPAYALLSIAALSCFLMYSTAMSTQIVSVGAFVGFGLAVLLGWEFLKKTSWAKSAFVLALSGYAALLVLNKYSRPYEWWSLDAPSIHGALAKFDEGILRGIYTTPKLKQAVERIAAIIDARTAAGDPIFAFPSIPIFYILSNRWPPTRSLVHWYDVADDRLVQEDLESLKQRVPRAIVVLDLPQDAMLVHERLFRSGRPSAQRGMLGWIRSETSSPVSPYHLEYQYDGPGGASLKLWIAKPGMAHKRGP